MTVQRYATGSSVYGRRWRARVIRSSPPNHLSVTCPPKFSPSSPPPADLRASFALRDAGNLPIALCWELVSWCWTARRISQARRRCAIGSRGHVESMFEGLDRLVNASREAGTRKNKITSLRHVMNLSSADHRLVSSVRIRDAHPKLILTSPPYPGVHVLYHRWQILGRRETPVPYWIAHLRDGHGEAYYTMGGRSAKGISNYFESISRVFTTIRQVVSRDTQVVQLVAFSDANSQLPLYLDAMAKAGFEETYPDLLGGGQVRLVPNRKWYNQQRQSSDASREHLLVHRPATDPS